MKGQALILIFLFLILCLHPVTAVDDSYEYTASYSIDYSLGEPGSYGGQTPLYWNVGDVETLATMDFLQFECYNVTGIENSELENSEYGHVDLYSDSGKSQYIGSGILGYIKVYNENSWYLQLFIDDDLNWNGLTGNQKIYWEYWSGQGVTQMWLHNDVDSSAGTEDNPANDQVYLRSFYNVYEFSPKGTATVQYTLRFINNVTYDYNASSDSFEYYLNRSSTYPSYLKISNDVGILTNETTIHDTDRYYPYGNTTYKTWYTSVTTQYGDEIYLEINWSALMDDGPATEGAITLSQLTYVKPDPVLANIDLENADYINYRYYATIQNHNGTAWVDLTSWERIRSDWEKSKVWEYTWTENLPLTIRGAIYEYDLNADTYDMISYSTNSTYVEPPPDTTGSISTDKTVYDVGDTVTINYTVADSAFVIAQKWPTAVWNQGEYYIWEVPGSGTRTFVIPPSGTGEWRVRLSANNQEVDTVFFTVNDTTTVYLAWHDIDGILGETQAVHFYSDDVAATLKIYDADQTAIYDETVGDGYFPNYAISTQTNQAPGTWTASLNNSGSYYNGTLLMYAKDAYLSFNADSYVLDQTITINYYLKRSTQSIVLYDSNGRDIITWTTAGNYIHHGIGSVDFTLSDDNEYGLDIIAGVDANNIKLGLWKVEVLDRGQPIADNPVYDSAKVSRSDDPADTSNEMISIIFSPEGVFMLFTVCLTMMGLAIAQHPAGGGAGAVVGVGFGVYFNVLPVWMLFLTVIALVVLAGVSIAVHVRGK